jgi:hypothetical protein
MNKSTIFFGLNWPKIFVNSMWIQKCIYQLIYIYFSSHKICSLFEELQVLISSLWLDINLFYLFIQYCENSNNP